MARASSLDVPLGIGAGPDFAAAVGELLSARRL